MNSMERKNIMNERKSNLVQRLSMRFEQVRIRDNLCFRKKDGAIFFLTIFPGNNALVIEYAENFEDALLYRFEDGDRFYLEDMDEAAMFEAMLSEIEQ